jgi:hypothetical protein
LKVGLIVVVAIVMIGCGSSANHSKGLSETTDNHLNARNHETVEAVVPDVTSGDGEEIIDSETETGSEEENVPCLSTRNPIECYVEKAKNYMFESQISKSELKDKWNKILDLKICVHAGGHLREEYIDEDFLEVVYSRNSVITPFLETKISSPNETQIHVDATSDENATEGNLALYIIQIRSGSKWFEYNGKNKLIRRLSVDYLNSSVEDNIRPAELVARIVENEKARRELLRFFRRQEGISITEKNSINLVDFGFYKTRFH